MMEFIHMIEHFLKINPVPKKNFKVQSTANHHLNDNE